MLYNRIYNRVNNPKKIVAFLTSTLLHLLILLLISFSVENVSETKIQNQFELYEIKLYDVKPRSKDKAHSKPDSKKGKMVRKKTSNKAFIRKGKRQALAPKAPLENLKKTAQASMKNGSLTPPKVELEQPQAMNKIVKLESIEHQLELKQKLVEENQKKLAELDNQDPLKQYNTAHKIIDKKQINPTGKPEQQQAKNDLTHPLDELKRRQSVKLKDDFSKVKLDLKNKPTLPQEEREVKLSSRQKRATKVSERVVYQQIQQNSEQVEIQQRKLVTSTQSTPVARKTEIAPHTVLPEITQAFTKPEQRETFTQVTKKMTAVAGQNTLEVLHEFKTADLPEKNMERQVALAETTAVPQKSSPVRTMDYQQTQVQQKPVQLAQPKRTYNQQNEMLERKLNNAPTALNVAAATNSPSVQAQPLQAVSRRHTAVQRRAQTQAATLTSELAVEPIRAKAAKQQTGISQALAAASSIAQFKRSMSYQQKQAQQPMELTEAWVAYTRQSETLSRTVNVSEPTALDVAYNTQQQTAQAQTIGAISRQYTPLKSTLPNASAILSFQNMPKESYQQVEFGEKQVQTAKLETSTEVFVLRERREFEQRSTGAIPTGMIQQRVSYQYSSQGLNERSREQPTDLSGAVVQATGKAGESRIISAVATISRQEYASAANSTNVSVLMIQRYAAQETASVKQSQSRSNRVNLSSSTQAERGEQQKLLTVAYATESTRATIGAAVFSAEAGSSSLNGSPNSPMLSTKGMAADGEKNGPVIKTKLSSGNVIKDPLYSLRGEITGSVKQAFVTLNDITQLVSVVNSKYEVELAMVKGENKVSILAFDSSGNIGKMDLNLVYDPPPGVPFIVLESPPNGKIGCKEGDPVIVSGTIDDHSITQATLLLNGIPIALEVVNGRFSKKVFMPNARITTFRVMARNRNSPQGFSALHTILAGFDIDIVNPRPY